MSGFKSLECEDHYEREAREVKSVKIRAAQVVSALGALQFAAMVHELSGAGGAEARGVTDGHG